MHLTLCHFLQNPMIWALEMFLLPMALKHFRPQILSSHPPALSQSLLYPRLWSDRQSHQNHRSHLLLRLDFASETPSSLFSLKLVEAGSQQ